MESENNDEIFLESMETYRDYVTEKHPPHKCGACRYVTTDENSYAAHLISAEHKQLKRQKDEAYYQNELVKQRQHAKTWYQNNKEKKLQYCKEYTKDNRVIINEKRRAVAKINCECGGIYSRGGMKRHDQTVIHQNFIA